MKPRWNWLVLAGLATLGMHAPAWSRGASPYLPLNLSPETERQIERLLILADRPITARPIAAATVLDALPDACRIDEQLCGAVRRYLERYMRKVGLTHAGVEIAGTDGNDRGLPNRRGLSADDSWQLAAQGYWQPNDYAILSLGAVAYNGEVVPAGSMVSLGTDFAQLDIGYRDHWFSPFTDSAMIISTHAPTLPSVTLSNYRPLTRFGLRYEVFLAEMEESANIRFQQGLTSGKPRLAGLRFSVEPAAGWSLSANRMMQFGGGARGGRSFGDFFDALFKPHQNDNRSDELSQEQEFGNQVAAWTSRFIFPGPTPFAAYLEYAGEDSSYSGNYRLGNAALSIGLSFPRIWRRFDLTYEASEWQNGWYAHSIYLDGLKQDGLVLGHWGADSRTSPDEVGAQSHMLRIGWEPPFGGVVRTRIRTLANERYSSFEYERAYDLTVGYARTIAGMTAAVEVMGGRDVFGESFGRVAGSVRFGDEGLGSTATGDWNVIERPPGAELFVDTGASISRVLIRSGDGSPNRTTAAEVAPHVAIGARRAVSERSDLGIRAEIGRIEDDMLLAVRALDYRYRTRSPLAFSAFLGAARYDLATPAYGYYLGLGAQWRGLMPNVDLSLDLRYADKVARDKLLPRDPGSERRPDIFYDIVGATLSVNYRW